VHKPNPPTLWVHIILAEKDEYIACNFR